MALMQVRPEQVKAKATEYASLSDQIDKMSSHNVQVYIATGGETLVTIPNSGKYMPGSGNLVIFLNGQQLGLSDTTSATPVIRQYRETNNTQVTFEDPLAAGDQVVFVIIGAGAGFTVAMDHRYAGATNKAVLDRLSEGGDGKLWYKGAVISSAGSWIFREVPAGAQDGVNRIFTLNYPPVSGSEQVFFDGVLQYGDPNATTDTGTNDYWIDYNNRQVIFNASKIPQSTTVLQVTYMKR